MRVRTLSISFAVFLVLLVPAAASSITIEPGNASASPGEPAYFSLEFADMAGNFTVVVEAPGDIAVNPSEFSNRDRANTSVNIWFRPYSEIEEGTYKLAVHVFREGKLFRTVYPSVRVSNKHSIVLTSVNGSQCGDRQLSFTVGNRGMVSEKIRVVFAGKKLVKGSISPGGELNLSLKTEESGLLKVRAVDSYAHDSIWIQNNECGGNEILASFNEGFTTLKISLGIILLALTGLALHII